MYVQMRPLIQTFAISIFPFYMALLAPKPKMAHFANSIDLDEAAHYELPHLDLHCLPSSLRILNMIQLVRNNL